MPLLILGSLEGYYVERGGELKENTNVQKPKLIDVDRNTPYYFFYYFNKGIQKTKNSKLLPLLTFKKEHSNYVGNGDPKTGPVIISVEHPPKMDKSSDNPQKTDLRCLVRTKCVRKIYLMVTLIFKRKINGFLFL
jgi:hypothetical protein